MARRSSLRAATEMKKAIRPRTMRTMESKEAKRGSKPSECEEKHLLERNIRSHITNKHKVDEPVLVSRLRSAYL